MGIKVFFESVNKNWRPASGAIPDRTRVEKAGWPHPPWRGRKCPGPNFQRTSSAGWSSASWRSRSPVISSQS